MSYFTWNLVWKNAIGKKGNDFWLWSKSWIIREQENLSLGARGRGGLFVVSQTPSVCFYQHLWTAITSVKTGMPWQLTHLSCTSTTQKHFNWWQHSIERMTLFLLIPIDMLENVKQKSFFSYILSQIVFFVAVALSQTRFVLITDSTDSMSGIEIIWFNFGTSNPYPSTLFPFCLPMSWEMNLYWLTITVKPNSDSSLFSHLTDLNSVIIARIKMSENLEKNQGLVSTKKHVRQTVKRGLNL